MEQFQKKYIDLAGATTRPPVLIPRRTSAHIDDRRLPMVFVPSRRSNNLAIITAAWGETIYRPDVLQRLALQAEALESSVVGVANPGVHDAYLYHDADRPQQGLSGLTQQLSSAERGTLAHGDFTVVAQKIWRGLEGLLKQDRFEEARLTLLGYSLGATVAAAMAANGPADQRIDHLVLCEPIARAQHAFELARKYTRESKKWQQYKAERPAWAEPMPSTLSGAVSIARCALHNYAYASGLAANDLSYDVESSYRSRGIDGDSTVTIVSGSESHVSPEEHNDFFAVQLSSDTRANVRQLVLDGEGHGIVDSLERFAELMRTIAA